MSVGRLFLYKRFGVRVTDYFYKLKGDLKGLKKKRKYVIN